MAEPFPPSRMPIVYALIVVNIIVYVGMVGAFGCLSFSPRMLYVAGAGWSEQPLSEAPWRLITSAFIHVTPGHIISNMIALLFWGRQTEYRFGSVTFLVLYLLCALGSGVCSQLLLTHAVFAGASGAIAGVLGLMVILAFVGDPAIEWSYIGGNLVVNAVLAYIYPVNWIAHLSGLMCGIILGGVVVCFLKRPLSWQKIAASTAVPSSSGAEVVPMVQRARPVSSLDADTLYERLRKLAELRDKGILTEEEFVQQKTRLLNQ